ncbi:ABC transporter substrate-binding protein [Roseomonas sp. 18066]|uniref:ABC transporter substrate-binding protein n=1 Tax=Roseomonas sp. 18066 TaxID=2681412 RepID=UPI001358163F|nr:ABC transporter substrate-binding protein [Roseomonas sp. 18066]
MNRRHFLAASAAGLLARPALAQDSRARVLRFVPQANLSSFDPIWTTAHIARNHGYLVYDTLYAIDRKFAVHPQMAAGHVVEDDGRRWIITLRDNLRFHDGAPVRARDAVASIRRWAQRVAYGQKLLSLTEELSALDDRRLQFRLKQPFPLLPAALALAGQPPFIMPERVAQTDAFRQITETTGSGPYRFMPEEYVSGDRAVYARHDGYVPRPDTSADFLAGSKRAVFDRIEWRIIADSGTAAAALQAGEVDWFEQPDADLSLFLARSRGIRVEVLDPAGSNGFLRLNHLQAPFDDKRVRQAVLLAARQEDFLISNYGTDPAFWQAGTGVFTPGTPMASDAGLDWVKGGQLDRAKALLREAGRASAPARVLGATDIPAIAAVAPVAADLLQRAGFEVDFAQSDWGTLLQRRTSREPLEKGGWSAFISGFTAYDFADPATHPLLRGNGLDGYLGWPTVPALEALRERWFAAPDEAGRRGIAAEIQRLALEEVIYVPTGTGRPRTALRAELQDRVPGFPLFWNLRRG